MLDDGQAYGVTDARHARWRSRRWWSWTAKRAVGPGTSWSPQGKARDTRRGGGQGRRQQGRSALGKPAQSLGHGVMVDPEEAGPWRRPRRLARGVQGPAAPSTDRSASEPGCEAQQSEPRQPRFASIAIASTISPYVKGRQRFAVQWRGAVHEQKDRPGSRTGKGRQERRPVQADGATMGARMTNDTKWSIGTGVGLAGLLGGLLSAQMRWQPVKGRSRGVADA